jgi:hypothetical protein
VHILRRPAKLRLRTWYERRTHILPCRPNHDYDAWLLLVGSSGWYLIFFFTDEMEHTATLACAFVEALFSGEYVGTALLSCNIIARTIFGSGLTIGRSSLWKNVNYQCSRNWDDEVSGTQWINYLAATSENMTYAAILVQLETVQNKGNLLWPWPTNFAARWHDCFVRGYCKPRHIANEKRILPFRRHYPHSKHSSGTARFPKINDLRVPLT